MRALLPLGLYACLTALSGCAAIDPYPRVVPTASDKHAQAECSRSSAEPAVDYADCQIRLLEGKRDNLTRMQNGVMATLVPLSTLVAYKAARGANAGVLAAGGIAGYGTAQVLIQASRYAIYNEGVAAIVCAKGKYRQVQGGDVIPLRGKYEAALAEFRGQEAAVAAGMRDLLEDADTDPAVLEAIERDAEAVNAAAARIVAAVSSAGTGASADKALRSAVERIVTEVQLAIAGTVPPLSALSSYATTFPANALPQEPKARTSPPAGKAGPKKAGKAPAELVRGELDNLRASLHELHTAARYLVAALEAAPATSGFDDCHLSTTQGSYTVPNAPLMLGPGNSMAGKTLTVTQGHPAQIVVSGGQPPYGAAISGAPDGSEAKVVGENGVSYVRIALGADLDPDAKATVTLTDARALAYPAQGTRTMNVVSQ